MQLPLVAENLTPLSSPPPLSLPPPALPSPHCFACSATDHTLLICRAHWLHMMTLCVTPLCLHPLVPHLHVIQASCFETKSGTVKGLSKVTIDSGCLVHLVNWAHIIT